MTPPLESLRKDFPILQRKIHGKPIVYLDSAATSQKPLAVLNAIRRFYEESNANVHRSVHTLGEEATALYEGARDRVARFVGASHREGVIFTRGTTEAINLVAASWGRSALKEGDEIVLTELEHHSNLIPWQLVAKEKGARLVFVPVREGEIDLSALQRCVTPRTRLIAVTALSNALGSITSLAPFREAAHSVGALFLVDAAQAVPHLTVDFDRIGCDFLAFSGHKMLGPNGIGVLVARPELLEAMPPFMGGGEMIREVWTDKATWNRLPWKFEAGTPPAGEAVGLAAAIDYLEGVGMETIRKHDAALAERAAAALSSIRGVTLYGPKESKSRGPLISFNCEGIHPHDLAAALDEEGVAIRAGHHCAQPLMRRLGIAGTARASFYLYNNENDLNVFIEGVAKAGDLFRSSRL
jgi:cysteine desulfurase/selenocysteine lyase